MVLGLTAGFALSADLGAVPLTLHRTGEGLTQGNSDVNWNVKKPDGSVVSAISANDVTGPPSGWITPISGGTWISIVSSGNVPAGTYEYSTRFEIGLGLDPSTAQISGSWYADEPNVANGIMLNGVSVSAFQGAIWNEPNPANAAFSITSGFVQGWNTLTFLVTNTAGPGGTLVQNLTGSANAVPDSGGSLVLLGCALSGLAYFRRKQG